MARRSAPAPAAPEPQKCQDRRKVPAALQAALRNYLEETPCPGPGELQLATSMEAMLRAETKSHFTVCGRKLSRVEVMEMILDLVAEGHALLHLTGIEGMPRARTIAVWLHENKSFRDALEIAERMRATLLADEAIEIIDGTTIKRAFADKARADLRMKMASALDPKKFGRKLTVDDPNHVMDLNSNEVWSRFRSILIVHADLIKQNTGIKIDVPVQDAEIVSSQVEEPRELDVMEVGMQGGLQKET